MIPKCRMLASLHFFDFENRQELMVTQFEERVALAFVHPFEIENILVKATAFST